MAQTGSQVRRCHPPSLPTLFCCSLAQCATTRQRRPFPAWSAALQAAAGGAGAPRQKVDKLSSEVVDSNPYSRLMALQRMGIVKDYEQIRNKTVGGEWAAW